MYAHTANMQCVECKLMIKDFIKLFRHLIVSFLGVMLIMFLTKAIFQISKK